MKKSIKLMGVAFAGSLLIGTQIPQSVFAISSAYESTFIADNPNASEQAMNVLYLLDYLTEDEQASVREQLSTADSSTVEEVLEQALTNHTQSFTAYYQLQDDLEGAKDEVRWLLDNSSELTSAQISYYTAVLESDTAIQEVGETYERLLAVEIAYSVASPTLETLTEEALSLTADSFDLTPEEVADYTTQINAATSVNELKDLMDELMDVRQSAPVTTEEDETESGGEFETPEQSEEAPIPAPVEIDRTSAFTTLYELESLTFEELQSFETRVVEALTQEDVDSIILEAQAVNQANKEAEELAGELESSKQTAREVVEAFYQLPEEEKSIYLTGIESALTQEDIDYYVTQAEQANNMYASLEIEGYKEEAITHIYQLTYLTQEEQVHYIQTVEEATTQDWIAEVIERAETTNTENREAQESADLFMQEKENAYVELAAYEYLTEDDLVTFEARIEQAQSVEEIQSVLSEAYDLNDSKQAQAVEQEALNELKEQSKVDLQNLTYLTPEDILSFEERIDQAQTSDEVHWIVSEANTLNTEIQEEASAQEALNELKEQSKANLISLRYLTVEEMVNFETRIDQAQTSDEVQGIVNEATALNTEKQTQASEAEALNELKQQAKVDLQNLTYLTDEEYQTIELQIDQAQTAEDIQTILRDANGLNEDNQAQASEEEALRELREQTKLNLQELTYLTGDQQATYLERVEQAENKQAIETIYTEAEADNELARETQENENALEEARTESLALLETYTELTDEEYQTYYANIEQADTHERINALIEEAAGINEQNRVAREEEEEFNRVSQEAIAEIEGMEYLNSEDVERIENELYGRVTVERIQEILQEARALNEQREQEYLEAQIELAESKEQAIADLPSYSYLTDEEYVQFTEAINGAETQSQLDDILAVIAETNEINKGTATNEQKELQESITFNIDALNSLRFLTEEDRELYRERLRNAQSTPEVNQIYNDALTLDRLLEEQAQEEEDEQNTELETAKQAAKDQIEAFKHLTKEKKETYQSQIEEAVEVLGVDIILAQATAENQASQDIQAEQLAKVKEVAKAEITALTSLTEEQRAEFNEEVSKQTSEQAVLDVLDQAKALNMSQFLKELEDEELNSTKEQAITAIEALEYLTESEKEAYTKRINDTEDALVVDQVLQEATTRNTTKELAEQLKERELKRAKQLAIQSFERRLYITHEEDEPFIERINKATTVQEIQAVLDEADALNAEREKEAIESEQDLQQSQTMAERAISQLTYLTANERQNFINEVKGALDKEEVYSILGRANERNKAKEKEYLAEQEKEAKEQQKLTDTKTLAVQNIGRLPHLSTGEINHYAKQVQEATTIEAVNKVVQEAINRNIEKANEAMSGTKELKQIKHIANQTINRLPHLTQEQKSTYQAQVYQAKDRETVQQILQQAQEQNAKQASISEPGKITPIEIESGEQTGIEVTKEQSVEPVQRPEGRLVDSGDIITTGIGLTVLASGGLIYNKKRYKSKH